MTKQSHARRDCHALVAAFRSQLWLTAMTVKKRLAMTVKKRACNDSLLSLRGVIAVARRSRSKLEHEIPRFTRNKLRNLCPRIASLRSQQGLPRLGCCASLATLAHHNDTKNLNYTDSLRART